MHKVNNISIPYNMYPSSVSYPLPSIPKAVKVTPYLKARSLDVSLENSQLNKPLLKRSLIFHAGIVYFKGRSGQE